MKNITRSMMLFLALAVMAWAHGNGPHIMGMVRTVNAHSITVATMQHQQITVKLDKDTQYRENGKPEHWTDVHPGDRIVIHTEKRAGGLFAEEVQFAPMQMNMKKMKHMK